MDAFLYLKRSRALPALLFVLALLFAPVSGRAETEIRSLTGIIEGHQVGGVMIERKEQNENHTDRNYHNYIAVIQRLR